MPWRSLAISALAALALAFPSLGAAWEFQRIAVTRDGELWRLMTAHLTHFDFDHLCWDVAALLILGSLAERAGRRATVLTLLSAALVIGLGVWLFQPRFDTYRGLSGLDSALYGLVCARLVADGVRARHGFSVAIGALALTGFALKCGAELTLGETVFTAGAAAGYAPVPLAHVLGLGVGLCAALVEYKSKAPAPANSVTADQAYNAVPASGG